MSTLKGMFSEGTTTLSSHLQGVEENTTQFDRRDYSRDPTRKHCVMIKAINIGPRTNEK